MASIFDVAEYILQKCGDMSVMKLQKLCYYSQAWSLVWDDEELFPEEFEAWATGPICRKLYDLYQGLYKVTAESVPKELLTGSLTENQMDTINHVLEHYAEKNAQWLSQLTHMEKPWQVARNGYAPGENCSNTITKASMAEYYGAL